MISVIMSLSRKVKPTPLLFVIYIVLLLSCDIITTTTNAAAFLTPSSSSSLDSIAKRKKGLSSSSSSIDRRPRAEQEDELPVVIVTSESNFWFSKTIQKKEQDNRFKKKKNTFDPTLDLDGGPLPPECYQILFGDAQKYEPKPTCLLTNVINLSTLSSDILEDPSEVIVAMQQFVDYGLTTFQLKVSSDDENNNNKSLLKWGQKEVFGAFYRDTPAFAHQNCNLILPLTTPPIDTEHTVCKHSVRQSVLDSLHSMGGLDAIDTLQLEYCKDSPYHLEMLDYLMDLQRDGFIRSIGTSRNMPPSIIQQAQKDLSSSLLSSNQLDCNLLDPNPYSKYNKDYYYHGNDFFHNNKVSDSSCTSSSSSSSPSIFLSSPLAGGLLTSRHYNNRQEGSGNRNKNKNNQRAYDTMPDFSLSEQQHISTSLRVWGEQRDIIISSSSSSSSSSDLWNEYHKEVLETLSYIALKHRVSIESVAIRWTMQLDDFLKGTSDSNVAHIGSVMVDSKEMIFSTKDNQPMGRKLREVFRFELDEEDLESLLEISGQEIITTTPEDAIEKYYTDGDFDDDDDDDGSSFVPDFTNQKLWL